MSFTKLFNTGIHSSTGHQADKIRITNIVSIITCLVATLYAGYFYVALNQPQLAVMNLFFVVAYGCSVVITKYQYFTYAKLWLFVVLMVHVFILSTQVFTASAGFHFYYLLLPSGIFLLFEDSDEFEKLFVMITGSLLFFVCYEYQNTNPVVVLSKQAEQAIFLSAISVILLEIYLVMSLFSRAIAKQRNALTELASKDGLTGINNRRTLVSIGSELFEHAKRYQKPLSLIILDIDHFKAINDTHGHIVGDKVLKKIATSVEEHIRASDVLARYGGEEFVIVLPETKLNAAIDLAADIKAVINSIEISLDNANKLSCTASFGVANLNASIPDFMQLINCADEALYQAKRNGRDQVIHFE